MSNLNMINNDNMISASSSNNISPIPQQSPIQDSKDNRIMELRVAEQSLDFSNRNFSREVYIYHKKQERFKKTVMGVHTIVSKKLYRLSDLTLEEYFRSRWKISRAQVYRFLDAAEVLKQLNEFTFLPSHELLCRTLKQHAKCPEHMKILWESVLSKVGDHLTSINSSLISSTWMELIKDGKVVPLPPQPKKAKKRSRKSGSLSEGETGDLSSVKVIKTKHPNLSNDENKLAYNLLEYNEKQINSNIKTNNIGKRASNYKISSDMNTNEYGMNHDYYGDRDRDMNPHYGPPNSDYGRSPNMRSPLDYNGMPPRNSMHLFNNNSNSYNNGNYSNYDLNSSEPYSKNRNDIPISNNKSQFYPIDTTKNNNNNSNDRYYNDGGYHQGDRGRDPDMYKYRNDDRDIGNNMNRNKSPNAPYYIDDNRNPSPPLVNMSNGRPPNLGPDNGRYSNYDMNPPDIRNRNNDPNRPPFKPDPSPNQKPPIPYYESNRPPNDRYYDDYNNNRNNNDNMYRYRNESNDKLNRDGYNPPNNMGMSRPMSPVSMNVSSNLRNEYPQPSKPDVYDNGVDNKRPKPYYYPHPSSPNQTRNPNPLPYNEPPVKTNIKYISSPMTNDINPRVSNINISDSRNNNSNLPSHSNTILNPPLTNNPAGNIDRNGPDFRSGPPNKNYPPPDDRFYKGGEPGSNTANGNTNIQPPPPPPIDNIKDGFTDPTRTPHEYTQDSRYPPRNEEFSKNVLPSHQLTSPHNSQNIISEPSGHNFSNDTPSSQPYPPKRPSFSPSINGGSQTDPNRFSLYKISSKPNSSRDQSPKLPPISVLNNNEPFKNSSGPYPEINKNGNRNEPQSFDYRQDNNSNSGRRPFNENTNNSNYENYNYQQGRGRPPLNKDNQRDPNNFQNPDRNINRNDLPPYYPESGAPPNSKNGPGPGPRPIGPIVTPATVPGSGTANRIEGYTDDRYNNSNAKPNTPGSEPPERGNPNFYGSNNRNGGDINSNNGNNGRYYHSFK